jgi:hypothetical protein
MVRTIATSVTMVAKAPIEENAFAFFVARNFRSPCQMMPAVTTVTAVMTQSNPADIGFTPINVVGFGNELALHKEDSGSTRRSGPCSRAGSSSDQYGATPRR